MREQRSRRDFLARASALGAAGLLHIPRTFAADPPPETTRIRLMKASLCTAPAYVAEELLRREGFPMCSISTTTRARSAHRNWSPRAMPI